MNKDKAYRALRNFVLKVLEGDAPVLYQAWRKLTLPVLVVCSVIIFTDMSLHGRMLAAVVLLAVLWGMEWFTAQYIMFWWRIRRRWRYPRRWDTEP